MSLTLLRLVVSGQRKLLGNPNIAEKNNKEFLKEECIVVDEGIGCTSMQEDMFVDEFPLIMKVMVIFVVVRVTEIIIYFLLILFKFQ